jgi:uncharacterized protein with PIN domain
MSKSASFSFQDSLNDFLPRSKRNTTIIYEFNDVPAIKHSIETIGIPHTEVDAILVNGAPVDFFYPLQNNDKVEVYPASLTTLLPTVWLLTPANTIPEKFILDVHLGKLARRLRLLGFDTFYENNYTDKEIVQTSEVEERIILTRDRNLLKYKSIKLGYWIPSQHVEEQLTKVIKRFRLENKLKFFERCVECNGKIIQVEKDAVFDQLLPKTKLYYNDFFQCDNCKRIYWRGSHYDQMRRFIKRIEEKLRN